MAYIKHGMYYSSVYRAWQDMKTRCYSKAYHGHKRYKNRYVCDEWKDNFKLFYDHVSKLENYNKEGYSLDRINNEDGYRPGNVRWATAHEQVTNTRVRKDNKTGYIGVWLHEPSNKYHAYVTYFGKRKRLGSHSSAESANAARINYLMENEMYEYIH
jgi:hypothetical protein